MVDKDIDVIYRPREEKEENLRYKEERKKAEKAAENMEKGITDTDELEESSEETKMASETEVSE